MDILCKHILIMKERPGMYLGKKSIDLLRVYVDGFLSCMYEQSNKADSLFFHFTSFVETYYKVGSSAAGWNTIILNHSVDDEKALDKFFTLFEQFLAENNYEQR